MGREAISSRLPSRLVRPALAGVLVAVWVAWGSAGDAGKAALRAPSGRIEAPSEPSVAAAAALPLETEATHDFGGAGEAEVAKPKPPEPEAAVAEAAIDLTRAAGRADVAPIKRAPDPALAYNKGDPSAFYEYGLTSLAPVFHESSGTAFKALVPDASEAGASGILRRLIAEHEAARPPGWDKLVERVVQARAEGGEMGMALTADALVNETPYIDHTGGVYFSPKRFFERGGAVCKDFANVKYLLLRDAGFSVDQMRIAALAPGAGSGYADGHAVLLVALEGQKEPYVLDLPNPYAFNQSLAAAKETLASRASRMKSLGPDDKDPDPKLANAVPLSRYNQTPFGGARGLLMASNEVGARFFTLIKPPLQDYEELWVSSDASIKALRGNAGVWVAAEVKGPRGSYPVFRRMGEAQAEKERILAEKAINSKQASKHG